MPEGSELTAYEALGQAFAATVAAGRAIVTVVSALADVYVSLLEGVMGTTSSTIDVPELPAALLDLAALPLAAVLAACDGDTPLAAILSRLLDPAERASLTVCAFQSAL